MPLGTEPGLGGIFGPWVCLFSPAKEDCRILSSSDDDGAGGGRFLGGGLTPCSSAAFADFENPFTLGLRGGSFGTGGCSSSFDGCRDGSRGGGRGGKLRSLTADLGLGRDGRAGFGPSDSLLLGGRGGNCVSPHAGARTVRGPDSKVDEVLDVPVEPIVEIDKPDVVDSRESRRDDGRRGGSAGDFRAGSGGVLAVVPLLLLSGFCPVLLIVGGGNSPS